MSSDTVSQACDLLKSLSEISSFMLALRFPPVAPVGPNPDRLFHYTQVFVVPTKQPRSLRVPSEPGPGSGCMNSVLVHVQSGQEVRPAI